MPGRPPQAFDAWMRAKPVDIGNTVRRNLISSARPAIRKRPPPNTTPATAPPCACCRWRWPVTVDRRKRPFLPAAPRPTSPITTTSPMPPAKPWSSWCRIPARPRHRRRAARARRRLVAPPSGFRLRQEAASRTRAAMSSTPCRRCSRRFFGTASFEECLIDVVNRGGDADTTGAIAGMLAGARYGGDAIPARWLKALDPHVSSQCSNQARALLMQALS